MALRHSSNVARRGPPIEVADGKAAFDGHGNVRDGIRSPFVDVPTAKWTGRSTGASFCFIAGHEIPFDKTKLEALYHTHAQYMSAVQSNVDALVREGIIALAAVEAVSHRR